MGVLGEGGTPMGSRSSSGGQEKCLAFGRPAEEKMLYFLFICKISKMAFCCENKAND